MGRFTVIVLVLAIAIFVGGFFYLNNRQESESGYKDGVKMGYLYGFHDGKAGSPIKTENLGEILAVEGGSTYDKAFLVGAKEGYIKGYAAGEEVE